MMSFKKINSLEYMELNWLNFEEREFDFITENIISVTSEQLNAW